MKKRYLLIFLLIILIFLSVNVMASNKLITVPTADLEGAAHIYGEIFSSKRQVEMTYNVNPQIEFGVIISSDKNRDAKVGLIAKTVLIAETEETPAFGVGIRMNDLYLVTSKNLAMGIKGHLGIGNGNLSGLFIAFNTVLNPVTVSQSNRPALPPISLMGEYANEKINIGVSMRLQEDMKFGLALLDMKTMKFGLGYSF